MIAWRHYILVGLFLAMIGALCVRVVYLGVTQKNFLQQQGDARSVRREVMPAMRGAIVDRNGEPLAVSTPVFSVWIDPSRAEVSATTLHKVARLLGLQGDTLARRLADNQRREHLVLARRVRWDVAERLRALKIKHLYLDNEYRRYYPAAETTAHVVGVTDIKDQGAEGVEYALNDRLSGKHGAKIVLKDQLGQTIRDLEYIAAPVYGQEVKLTLDQRLQYVAYSELKSAVQSHKAKSGSLVMVDARNGDILALVNQPSYNPNDIPEKMLGMRNRAVTDPYEPGSTIKPFTALAALESGHFKADTLIDTHPGFFHVGKKLIEDPVNRKVISLSQAIQKSSQVAIAKVAMDLPEDAVFDVLSRAGLGDYLGSGLPGEVMGYFASDQLRYPVVQATFSYGYGLSVTPVQLAQAYAVLGAGGLQRPVTLLKLQQPPIPRRIIAE
ncbi:MAG: penicillin-binding transpeptidase domain-containing protein, partial [Pseudomonadota bacterium]